jgi:nucleoside-diphosphate-sugar epimerase
MVERSSETSAKDTHSAAVLIAGCGYTGRALGQRLIRSGYATWGLSRRPYDFPPGLQPLAADLTDSAALAALPKSFDYVVYCASADTSSDDAYRRAYVEGALNVIRHVDASRVRRFFFVSSTAVYGQDEGRWVDEASPTTPAHFSGRRTLEAEAIVHGSGLPSTVLRCSGIYGPGRDRLVVAVRRGEPMTVSERYTNRIHRDDIAGVVLHLIEHGTSEPTLLVSDDEPTTQKQIVEFVAARLGVALPPLTIDDQPSGARGGNKRCNNARLKSTGYQLEYPTFREGYASLLS